LSVKTRLLETLGRKESLIEQHAREHKLVIYGGRAVQAQGGFLARQTSDYDLSTAHPKREAGHLTSIFNRESAGRFFYQTPSKKHKGTEKVRFVGFDFKRGTKDDFTIADVSKTRPLKTVNIQGIRYARLSETAKDKAESLKDENFEFRHGKDREDLQRINAIQKVERLF